MDRKSFSWPVVIVAVLILCTPTLGQRSGPEEKTMSYGGEWWLSRSSIEQRGYINGDADCYTSELKGELKNVPPAEKVQAFVNHFYEDPTHWSVPVFRVIRMFNSRRGSVPIPVEK